MASVERTATLLLLTLATVGCQGKAPAGSGTVDMIPADPRAVPADPQRSGDPTAGYHALVNNGYVSCGIPYSLYHQFFGDAAESARLPGRDGPNATLPYYYTAFTAKSGAQLVSANCLTCHATYLQGKVVVGLGAQERDFTTDQVAEVGLAQSLVTDPTEKMELDRFSQRVEAIAPYTKTLTIGVNPADNLTAVLFSHRDPKTLAWSVDPMIPLPPAAVAPVDVPPWWRMKKKNAMFYLAAGRGDHARIMMTASTLCTDSVDEARQIDGYFNDVEAFITSITPPAWPFAIDAARAQRGMAVFAASCLSCHGSYGEGYPNLVIALDDVGTDSTLALGTAEFADRYLDWFKQSFFGETARLEPQKGYIAPPLDGIWSTAPFLHNGSVPTLAALLDSKLRPVYWTRSFDSNDYDPAQLGWRTTAVDHGQGAEPDADKRKRIYDTTLPGYGSSGHTYGDALSSDDRSALLEYLKTL